jgi:hypothetical protein
MEWHTISLPSLAVVVVVVVVVVVAAGVAAVIAAGAVAGAVVVVADVVVVVVAAGVVAAVVSAEARPTDAISAPAEATAMINLRTPYPPKIRKPSPEATLYGVTGARKEK